MHNIALHINKLSHAQLRRAKTLAIICAMLVTLGQGLTGYLLVSCYDHESGFAQVYEQGNKQLAEFHRESKSRIASILDLIKQGDQKANNQKPFTISFNLFMEAYGPLLPDCIVSKTVKVNNFEYKLLYKSNHYPGILHPPQLTSQF